MIAADGFVLTLDPHPGSTGGHVGGVIEMRQIPSRATEFRVELSCTRFRHRTQERSSSVVWQDIARFPCRMRADGAIEVPFCFYVPEQAPNTSEPPGDSYTWRLQISSTLAGEDFIRHWNVPVLASGVQASPPIAALAAIAPSAAEVDAQLHLTHDASGLTLDYPAGRYAVAAGYMLAFGVAFCGAAWLIGHFARRETMMPFFCWLFGVPASAGGLWLLGNALRVEVRRGSLFIRRSLFGLPVARTELGLSRVEGIGVTKSGMSEQGAEARVFYRVQVKTLDGSIQTIGEGFVGYSAATHAALRLSELTGLNVLGGPPAPAPVQQRHEPAERIAAQRPAVEHAAVQRAAAARVQQQNESAAECTAAPRLQAANTFIDRLVDNRQKISSYRYIGQGIVAVLFLLGGYAFGLSHLPVLLQGTKTTGTIVDSKMHEYADSRRSRSDTSYAPIVEFHAENRTVRVEGIWGSRSQPTKGETVTVMYEAGNPSNAIVDVGVRNWLPWAPFSAAGAFLAFVAIRSWLAAQRR